MRVEVEIPPKEQAVRDGCRVALAPKGVAWKESCLGKNAKETGVYVIHHGGDIKYVGKTDAPGMSFGMRLRREFQQSASGGKHLYPKLASLTVPPAIMVSFFSSVDLKTLVQTSGITLSSYQAIEILETVMIHAYRPDFQRHHVNRTVAYLKKLGYTRQDELMAMLETSSSSDSPQQKTESPDGS